jgi:hypothetical protein
VSVGIGIGYPGFYGGYYAGGYSHHYGHYRPWGWHHRPYGSTVVIGGFWGWPDYYPGYYVVDPPPAVIERAPVVIERQTVVAQPNASNRANQAFFQNLRDKKNNLLNQLASSDKAQREKAINELAGFSFDDNIRIALENVLFTDPDAQLRAEVAHAFGEVKNAKALPALEKARVADSSQDVRMEADKAIKNLQNS